MRVSFRRLAFADLNVSVSETPDWRDVSDYAPLLSADPSAFAWEWTRRSSAYRQAWFDRDKGSSFSRRFGLERFEDPDRGTPTARPIWSRSVDASVITAKVQRFRAAATDRVDLLDLQGMLSLCVDENQDEHLLLSDGFHFLRIDVIEGTLLGCPAVLHYLLEGFDRIRGPMRSIERLTVLKQTGRILPLSKHRSVLSGRWITELRIADALANGADHQDIARLLYGLSVAPTRWRTANPSLRTRVQRLARTVRLRLAQPADPRWFAL